MKYGDLVIGSSRTSITQCRGLYEFKGSRTVITIFGSFQLLKMLTLPSLCERETSLKTSGTIFREHLYELAGFKKFFGHDLVQKIVERKEIVQDAVVNLPVIDFGLMGWERFKSFMGLAPLSISNE